MAELMDKAKNAQVTEQAQQQPRHAAEEQEQALTLRPPADVFETEQGVSILLDMPGVSRDRLNIQADRRNLLVEGEAEIAMPEGMEALWADVRSTRYRRSFALGGEQLDTDAITANLKDGLLRLDIPKRAEHRPRRIEIQTS